MTPLRPIYAGPISRSGSEGFRGENLGNLSEVSRVNTCVGNTNVDLEFATMADGYQDGLDNQFVCNYCQRRFTKKEHLKVPMHRLLQQMLRRFLSPYRDTREPVSST
jgi:hypothetical protein